jgi:tetratricopeptide (TPR) repeat protein
MRLAELPVLLLLTATGPIPDGLRDLDAVHLGPLPPPLQARMIAGWLDAERVDDALLALVVGTCEGNPLYIEELLKYLVERRLVRVDAGAAYVEEGVTPELPDTLGGLLAARIDALDPASKGALQIAAVLGTEFSVSLLGDAVGVDDPLPLVGDLAAHGLVRRGDVPDTWTLASEFVRRAALHGILGVQRRDHHRLIAAAIERRAGDDPAWTEALAHHCGLGGRPLDAARYAYAAGLRHEDARQLDEARACYRAGLGWIAGVEERPDTYEARVQGEAMLRLRLGAVSLALGETKAGLGALRGCIDVAEEARLPWLEVRAHLELGRHHLGAGERTRARAHLAQAWALARLGEDRRLELDVASARGRLAVAEGKADEAIAVWSELLDRTPEPDLRASALIGLAEVHLRSGAAEAARAPLAEALEVARAAVDRAVEGKVLEQLGLLHAWLDQPDDAVRHLRRAVQVREELGATHDVVVDHHHIGDVHFLRGDLTRAWLAFRQSRELAEEVGWSRGVALNDVYLGYIDASRGDPTGVARIEEAIRVARRCGDAEAAASGEWLLGRLALAEGRAEDARGRLQAALAAAESRQAPLLAAAVRRTLDTLGSA